MPYTLHSRGTLVGHTDLDIRTITPTMRQGFVEPTDEGRPLLAAATGVWRAIAEMKRTSRARGNPPTIDDHMLVRAAVDRRENLCLELRDEGGAPVPCEFIRITDLFDLENGIVDEMDDTEEEEQAAFEIRLSAMSADDRARAIAQRAEMDAAIQADAELLLQEMREDDDDEGLGSEWPPAPPEDPRWQTMQYLIQAHLGLEAWESERLPGVELTE